LRRGYTRRIVLVLIAGCSTAATVLAMRRTSTTFDEIVLIAGGARGFEFGKFDLAPEHPPLMQYLYGLPAYLTKPKYPPERAVPPGNNGYRYLYAQEFFWLVGNDAERLAFVGRLIAALCVLGLVLITYAFTARASSPSTALAAAALVGFLPDVLAHGGVAYNDVPLALAFFAAVWALDVAVRKPSVRIGAIAGALSALAIGIKFSAGALLPVGLVLLIVEAIAGKHDRAWWNRILGAACAAILAGYLVLVFVYRFDFTLSELQYGLEFTAQHVTAGHGVPMYLLGKYSTSGFWYFYPVAFFIKTPVALHILLVLAIGGAILGKHAPWRELMRSPLRAPVVGAGVFLAFLMTSSLTIGFRYALPAIPLALVLVAAGAHRLSKIYGHPVRAITAGLVLWYSISALSWYPNYLAFTSEYRRRDEGHEALLDSSLDWGQGLILLREWMRDNKVPRVYLAYMGSGLPGGYGIRYVPLMSFFPLPSQRPFRGETEPEYGVVSATMLHGMYLHGDPYRNLRQTKPHAVIGHTMFVYKLD
jgi:4-amino-4-deoxy-L-arabinose transferase-like glycosyltransferase